MTNHAEIRNLVEQACVEFERDLKAYLTGLLRDGHQVDEIFQKTAVKAIQSAESVNPLTIRGWLFKIALNEVRELKRGSSRQRRLERSVWESCSWTEEKDGLFHAVSEEEKVLIRKAVARLNRDYREVVIRRVQKGQSFAVIAEEMDRPIGTVLTWMRRALLELREMNEFRRLSIQ